jgi:hypothetical protein
LCLGGGGRGVEVTTNGTGKLNFPLKYISTVRLILNLLFFILILNKYKLNKNIWDILEISINDIREIS